ncbi:SH2/SH3 adapter protein Nck1-like isoform X3 [Anguilla rostrata]|uniref:SH2/SH3 adapter protein Nck1-like isoform X3 n=1 Tax=Anguilla rostrata TaxID=7938 RepID=UPI0030D50AFA
MDMANLFKHFFRIGKVKRKTSMRDTASNADAELCSDNGERLYDLNLPALVKFSYAAEREDELSLVKGTRVVVMEKCSDGWWRGVYEGRSGWFPSNYVTEDGDGLAGDPAASLTEKLAAAVHSGGGGGGGNGGRTLHTVQALYPFNSGNDEELSFEKGEVMDVVEKPENDPEWWKCRKADGQLGLVPKNYVTVLQNSHGNAPGNAGPPTPDCDYIEPSGSGRFAGRQWYYGKVTRHQAEVALNQRGEEGDFLIRDSESSPNDFSISLKAQGKNKHFKVQLKDSLYCIGQRKFNSMEELVDHYKKAPIFTSEQGDKLYLIKALS